MFPYDMPPNIGSSQWNTWFAKQPSIVKTQVVQAIQTMSTDQSLPSAMTTGGYAPELDPQSAGLLSMGAAPVERNTKGQTQPYDLGVASTTTNVLQDRGQFLGQNELGMQAGAGAYAADAFNPVYEPIGSPLQAPGSQLLQHYASSGGSSWQSYIADAILNKGLDPASAQADLIRTVTAPETATATPQEKAQRQALIESLPPRAIQDPLTGAYTMKTPDVTDLANTVDTNKIFTWGDDAYQKMATDPMAGYTDPKTGLDYAGAKTEDSTAAKWYHDRGLSLPTDQYTDPAFLDQIAPIDQTAVDAWNKSRADTSAAVDPALAKYNTQNDTYEAMQRAWEASQPTPTPAGVPDLPMAGGGAPGAVAQGGPAAAPAARTGTPFQQGNKPLTPQLTTGLPWDALSVMNGQPSVRTPFVPGAQPLTPFQAGSAWQNQAPMPSGTVTSGTTPPPNGGRSMYDVPAPSWVGQAATAASKDDSKNKKAPKTGKDLGAGFMMGTRPTQPGVDQAKGMSDAAYQALSQAITARRQAQEAVPADVIARALAYADTRNLAQAGRTRLGDQLAQRALAARASGLYGY